MGRWLRGENLPSLETLFKIANHCNLHSSYFFSDESNNNFINEEVFNNVFKLAFRLAEDKDNKQQEKRVRSILGDTVRFKDKQSD